MAEEINPFQSPQAMGAAAIPSRTTGLLAMAVRIGLVLLIAVMVANLVSAGSTCRSASCNAPGRGSNQPK